MRRAALLVLFWSLLELPRDVGFWLEGQPGLTLGMTLKLLNGGLATLGLWKGWRVGYACLVLWCLQGMLMSLGEWLGQGANPLSSLSIALRLGLIVWFVRVRILRREETVP